MDLCSSELLYFETIKKKTHYKKSIGKSTFPENTQGLYVQLELQSEARPISAHPD